MDKKIGLFLLVIYSLTMLVGCAETSNHRYHLMRARHAEAFALKQEKAAHENLNAINNSRASMESLVADLEKQDGASKACLDMCEKKLRKLGVRIPKKKK